MTEVEILKDAIAEAWSGGAEAYVVGPPLSERIDWSAALDAYFKDKGM